MNKTTLITSAAGIALMLASAAPAFAEDTSVTGSGGASVNTSGSVTVHAEDELDGGRDDQGEHNGLLNGLGKLKLMASSTVRADREAEREDRKASTTQNRIENGQQKSDFAIDARIKSLQDLAARLGSMKLLSADHLATIQAAITAEIQTLTNLKVQIGNDTSTTTLKADSESITKANRVYLLVEPKARIAASASRINAVVTQFTALATKLQDRITSTQTAGADVSAAVTAMSDFNVKIADAKAKADAAVAETANLQADNGDKTILAANLAALKDARTKLQAAEADLKAAHEDAKTIAGVVKGKGVTVTASSTTTTN